MIAILHIFLVFCYYGMLCLSGGGSLIPFYIDDLVETRHWLSMEEFGNFWAVSQVTPGPIGVNLATFLGFRQGGFLGGLAGTMGLLFPSLILMSLAVKSYEKWQDAKLVRSLLFGVKPITVSLVVGAMFAALGMSVFSQQLPFELLPALFGWVARDRPGELIFRWEMLPILAFSIYVLDRKKVSIMGVVFCSAAAGSLLYVLFGAAI